MCTVHFEHTCTSYLGRYPCLWCAIRADEMKVPRHVRGQCPSCTLESLDFNFQQFQTAGRGDTRQAKIFNNVVSRPFFDIPLNQVYTYIHMYVYYTHVQYITILNYRFVHQVYILPLVYFTASGHY